MQHLLFYDGLCGLCDRSVRLFLRLDKRERFLFAPLQGETAARMELPERNVDSMILVENYNTPDRRVLIRGVALLRAFWLLGGLWRVPGLFYFLLPSCIPDFFYTLVAKNRFRLFGKKECIIFPEEAKRRFLP